MIRKLLRATGPFLALTLLVTAPASAQYFGRNKVQYDQFDFKSFDTENFEFYLYPEEELAVRDAARMAERWYLRHQRTFLRQFQERKPIIFYANDADFQQTNAISGSIGQGTGGVTEALKERVIMPLTGSYRDTDHVLGHELVHSFQYDIALNSGDSTRFALQLLPLWLVEGMAEYFSVGREDPHTAMWMRDAAIRDDLPTIEQLSRGYQYFPYRYGQALLAYVGGKYGDVAVANLYKLGGKVGVDSSFAYTLGIKPDSLSQEWIAAVKDAYLPLTENRTPADSAGRKVLAQDLDAGDMNVSPSVSPDGQYVAFLSERDLFNINLFIADSQTGKVVKRLKGSNSSSHFDSIRFINSAGSWSPDGRKFVFVTFVQGDNELSILDWTNGSIVERISVKGVNAISNPAWSPDGQSIVFTGLDGGISDLYLLDLETRSVRQLTDDRFADLHPAWSPDGGTLAFVSDRGEGGTNFETLSFAKERVTLMDVETGEMQVLDLFDGTHINPQFSPDGGSIYFVSDHDGFKDVYRYERATEQVYRITHLQTGVSGITAKSPAMSVAAQSGRMMYSVFGDNKYTVFALEPDELVGTPIESLSMAEGQPNAGILPPANAQGEGLVADYLDDALTGLPSFPDVALRTYGPRLKLDYVAPPTVGVTAGGPFGSGIVGGIGMFFSDMLGNHNLTVVAQANGTFKDIGAQAFYLNQGNRFNYGALAGHIPILLVQTGYERRIDPVEGLQDILLQLKQRIFIDQLQGLASYPFTSTRRFELTGGLTRYGFDYEVERFIFSQFAPARRERTSQPAPDAVYFASAGVALVTDYSYFGFTSPVRGGRSRIELSPFYGSQTYLRAMLDYRRYLQIGQSATFALRGLHVGNYGGDRNTETGRLFLEEYLGYANSRGFVRGYSFSSFDDLAECTPDPNNQCAEFERLRGSRIALASAELRIPLLGTKQYGLVNFPYLPTEISFFADGGLAWNKGDLSDSDELKLEFTTDPVGAHRIPVFSTGVSTRFNMFGYTVLEIFYAKPFQRPGKGAHFGFQIVPGW